MSRIEVLAWKCDREGCGKAWYTGSSEKPKACARCKSRNWDVTPKTEPKTDVVAEKRKGGRVPIAGSGSV